MSFEEGRVTQPGEKQHTASVLIVTKDSPQKVLLMHHQKFNRWMQIGGHVESNENPWEAVVRETKEESNIDIQAWLDQPTEYDVGTIFIPTPFKIAQYTIPPLDNEPAHFHIDWMYVIYVPQAIPFTYEERAAYGMDWFTLEQVLDLSMFDNLRWMLAQVMT